MYQLPKVLDSVTITENTVMSTLFEDSKIVSYDYHMTLTFVAGNQ